MDPCKRFLEVNTTCEPIPQVSVPLIIVVMIIHDIRLNIKLATVNKKKVVTNLRWFTVLVLIITQKYYVQLKMQMIRSTVMNSHLT